MITNHEGQSTTPKRKAKEIVKKVLNREFDYLAAERLYREENMTDRDWMAVRQQLDKLFDRLDTVLQ